MFISNYYLSIYVLCSLNIYVVAMQIQYAASAINAKIKICKYQ